MKNKLIQMQMVISIWKKRFARLSTVIVATTVTFFSDFVHAATAATSLGSMASNVIESFAGLARLVTAGAYVAGVGFALTAILKFKAHKDNPTQIPIGTPIALLFVGAALLFLPSLFGIAGATIFGTTSGMGGVTGTTGG